MNEKPIERLNYFNGQRLQAADLKLEQDYHLRVRRWLNRSLYTSGIADGLVVDKVPGLARVRIGPGLALDTMGREIILIDEHEEAVPGAHDDKNLPLAMFLTIRYGEEVLARQDACCTTVNGSKDKAAAGGPSRVLAEPVFEWSRDLPHESSGKILLAYVALGKGCTEVKVLDTSVRRYIGAESASKVRQYALEGFRDINTSNEGVIRFHIRGRRPTSVTLYLRSDRFPTYFYTEIGKHDHGLTMDAVQTTSDATPNVIPNHKHPVDLSAADTNSAHGHGMEAYRFRLTGALNSSGDVDQGHLAFLLWDKDGTALVISPGGYPPVPWVFPNGATYDDITFQVKGKFTGGQHVHPVQGDTADTAAPYSHTHTFGADGTVDDFGATIAADRTGDAIDFINDLQLTIVSGGRIMPITEAVLVQLGARDQEWQGKRLGSSGAANHVFVTKGTGEIRIDMLPGVSIPEGEHEIHLTAPAVAGKRNGGRIYFNLYVE